MLYLFLQMRYTKKVSMWPVGLCTKYGISSPIVRNGSFAGFYDGWEAGRKFPVDMAGFAVSVEFLLQVITLTKFSSAFFRYIFFFSKTKKLFTKSLLYSPVRSFILIFTVETNRQTKRMHWK